jgi:hypothetical protein
MTNNEPALGRTLPLGQIYRILKDGRWAFYFDAHTLAPFSECPTKFFNRYISNAPQVLKHKGPLSAAMSIGSWWSRVSENFYKHMAARQSDTIGSGTNLCPTMMDILVIAGNAWVEFDMDSLSQGSPKAVEKYEKFALPISAGQFTKYFPQGQVAETFLQMYKDKAARLREAGEHDEARKVEAQTVLPVGPLLMAAQYYDRFAQQDFRDFKIISAEAPFGRHGDVCVGETSEVIVYWQGKPDLVVYENATGVLAPLDQKTKDCITKDVNEIWKPHCQLTGYVFALAQIARDLGFTQTPDRCIVSVCGRLPAATDKVTKLEKPRFARVRPQFSVEEIEEWRQGILTKAEDLRRSMERGRWTRNEFACHQWSGCDFRPLCSRPAGVRPLISQSDYIVTDPWSPFDEEE